jgi:hypothetical protein
MVQAGAAAQGCLQPVVPAEPVVRVTQNLPPSPPRHGPACGAGGWGRPGHPQTGPAHHRG